MDRILFGDNQFFSINHISEQKATQQSIQFRDDDAIVNTIDIAREEGIETFMCTTHERLYSIFDVIRNNNVKYSAFSIYPCMPYAHKYANAVTELGVVSTIKKYIPGNIVSSIYKGGMAMFSSDYISIMKLMIDAEMKMFYHLKTPVIFLQNVVTDLLLGLGMTGIFKYFHDYIRTKYKVEAGFITMNMPMLLEALEHEGVHHPIICCSINKAGFRMSGGIEKYENVLEQKNARIIAMQVLGGGSLPADEAIEYVCQLPNIESILFGASSQKNIHQTVSYIHHYDKLKEFAEPYISQVC